VGTIAQLLGAALILNGFVGLLRWLGIQSTKGLTAAEKAHNREVNLRFYKVWMRTRAVVFGIAALFIAGGTLKAAFEGEWFGVLIGVLVTAAFAWGSVWCWLTNGPFEGSD
jgi:hypothetical protein